MLKSLFGRKSREKRSTTRAHVGGFRPQLLSLENRDVPAVIYENTFALSGSGGDASVTVKVSTQVPLANADYTWDYYVTNISVGANEQQPYIDSDAMTMFWVIANGPVQVSNQVAYDPGNLDDPNDDVALTTWEQHTWDYLGNTGVFNSLYAGQSPTPNPAYLPFGSTVRLSFTTSAYAIGFCDATFGDDAFGEATGVVAGPSITTGVSVAGVVDPTESGVIGDFVFTRSGGDLSQPLTVNFEVSGTATEGIDFANLPRSVTFAANQYQVTLPVAAIYDSTIEGLESVVLTLQDGSGYVVNPTNDADLYTEGYLSTSGQINLVAGDAGLAIVDSAPVVWIDQAVREFDEGYSGNIIISRGGANLDQSLAVDVWFGPANGLPSATWGVDFTLGSGQYSPGWNTIVFAPNQTDFFISVTSIQDGIADGTEWLRVAIGENASYLPSVTPELAFAFADNPNDRTGERNGIDWTTLDLNDANKRRDAKWGKILGTEYLVKSKSGKELWAFTPLAANLQPAEVRQAGWEINYNCHGYSFDSIGIKFPGGQVRDFAIIEDASVEELFESEYKLRSAADAKADLAAGKRVIAVVRNQVVKVANGEVVQSDFTHSYVPATIKLKADGTSLDLDETKGNSKNGWVKFANGQNATATALQALYTGRAKVPPGHVIKTETVFYILK